MIYTSGFQDRTEAGSLPGRHAIGMPRAIPLSTNADVVRLACPTGAFPPWTDGFTALGALDDEAARRLARRLRDARVRRAAISVVAKALAERGYEGATYPYLARLAGLATQDVERVFPSKVDLVLATLGRGSWSGTPLGLPGGEIVSRFLTFWEQGDNTAIMRTLLCAAVSDRRLAAALERHVIGTVIRPFAQEDRSTDAYPRARLAFSALLGLAVSRYVLRQEPLASADHETLAAWMAPCIDHFLHSRLGEAMPSVVEAG